MRDDVAMALDTIQIDTGENPGATIIVLHGLGADGNDFVPFVEEIDLASVGPVRWIFPHAPTMPVTINGGYVMRAWYDILGTDMAKREDETGLRRSMADVRALLDAERARGIASRRIVLAGFSQGSAMTLLTGLRYPERLAGLVGMSGYLPLADALGAERAQANADVPVFLAHGRSDPVVPFAAGTATRDALRSAAYPVEWHDYPMPHSVCPEEIRDLERWLQRVLQ
jgi:phospholipase/carboxylesterase